jgi:hypothetical protein
VPPNFIFVECLTAVRVKVPYLAGKSLSTPFEFHSITPTNVTLPVPHISTFLPIYAKKI